MAQSLDSLEIFNKHQTFSDLLKAFYDWTKGDPQLLESSSLFFNLVNQKRNPAGRPRSIEIAEVRPIPVLHLDEPERLFENRDLTAAVAASGCAIVRLPFSEHTQQIDLIDADWLSDYQQVKCDFRKEDLVLRLHRSTRGTAPDAVQSHANIDQEKIAAAGATAALLLVEDHITSQGCVDGGQAKDLNLDAPAKAKIGLENAFSLTEIGPNFLQGGDLEDLGFQAPSVTVGGSTMPLLFPVERDVGNLWRMVLKLHGAPSLWIGIPAAYHDDFVKAMAEEFKSQPLKMHCAQSIGHLRAWPRISWLQKHNIGHVFAWQQQGEVMIFPPRTFAYGITLGASISETMHRADACWRKEDVEASGYTYCFDTCSTYLGKSNSAAAAARGEIGSLQTPRPDKLTSLEMAQVELAAADILRGPMGMNLDMDQDMSNFGSNFDSNSDSNSSPNSDLDLDRSRNSTGRHTSDGESDSSYVPGRISQEANDAVFPSVVEPPLCSVADTDMNAGNSPRTPSATTCSEPNTNFGRCISSREVDYTFARVATPESLLELGALILNDLQAPFAASPGAPPSQSSSADQRTMGLGGALVCPSDLSLHPLAPAVASNDTPLLLTSQYSDPALLTPAPAVAPTTHAATSIRPDPTDVAVAFALKLLDDLEESITELVTQYQEETTFSCARAKTLDAGQRLWLGRHFDTSAVVMKITSAYQYHQFHLIVTNSNWEHEKYQQNKAARLKGAFYSFLIGEFGLGSLLLSVKIPHSQWTRRMPALPTLAAAIRGHLRCEDLRNLTRLCERILDRRPRQNVRASFEEWQSSLRG